jgi:dTMP kinase
MSVKRGCIVCLEGIDGSGKDTQLRLLTHHLKADGIIVDEFNFPDYEGPLGSCIKSALSDPNFNPYALQLLFSAERLRQAPFLEQVVNNGKIAVTNRYKWSSYVYAIARGLPREWAENLEISLPDPDVTLLLDLKAEDSIRRTGGSDAIERDFEVLERCRQEYLKLAKVQKNWKVIDAHQDQTVILDILKAEVLNIINGQHELP